jgi:hypothetical protein
MPEKVYIRDDLQIIHIDSYGDVTSKDLRRSLERVCRMYREHGLTRIFINATGETSLPSTYPLFEFGSDLADYVQFFVFAVVVSPAVKDDLMFLETVTRNRGMTVRMFSSEKAAITWLLGFPASNPDAGRQDNS